MATATAAPLTKKPSKARWYRNVGGMYAHGKGEDVKYVKKGEKVLSTDDLSKRFVNNFEPCSPPHQEGDEDEGVKSPVTGEDVTELFPQAEGLGVQVFKDKKNYIVLDGDKPLNTEPLVTRAEVIVLLKSFTK